jgi:sirohydrochlorin ferrochelatase
VETAFLEQGSPDLAEAVARLAARGASRILVVPYFLTLGLHLQRDLPRIVADISRIQPGVEIRVTPPLDGHPAMEQALIERARAGEKPGMTARLLESREIAPEVRHLCSR